MARAQFSRWSHSKPPCASEMVRQIAIQLGRGAIKEAVDVLARSPERIRQAGQVGSGELIGRVAGLQQHPSQLQCRPKLGLHLQQHRLFQYIGKAQLSRQLPALGVDMKMLDLAGSHRRRQIGR